MGWEPMRPTAADVLALDGGDDIRGGQPQRGESVGRDPDPHAVIERAEQENLADPRHPRQGIDDVDGRVVA
jgi:hypothetical protein